MKKNLFLICFAILIHHSLGFAELAVSNQPTGAAVVITQPSAVFVTWSIHSSEKIPITVTSPEGLFIIGDQILGRVGTFLSTTIPPNGNGTVTETLLVPPSVTNRALSDKQTVFFYERSFQSTSSGGSGRSRLICRASTSAYGNFSIAAVTLFFQNERGEITFEQNDRAAQVTAEIRYNGTGLLKAAWEIQEPGNSQFRVLQQVQYHLAYGDRIVFHTPQVPPLPTVVTGRHLVRFRIDEPVSGFELPTIAYFVKSATQDDVSQKKIVLRSPQSRIAINILTPFEWNSQAEEAVFVKFSVYEKNTVHSVLLPSAAVKPDPNSSSLADSSHDLFLVRGVLVFSSTLPAKTQNYTLKKEQAERLRTDQWYLWQISGFDAKGGLIFESELRSFRTTMP